MKSTTIGVLAGMGPRSTSPFLELLLDECQKQYGAKYDIDYPHILIYSLPTPFYIGRNNNHEKLRESIKDGLKRLDSLGVDIIGIPCNSAHQYFEYITKGIDTPVLNIIEETLKGIEPQSKIAVFATELTMESGLYQKGIEQKKCRCIVKPEWQGIINSIILGVKNNNLSEDTVKLWSMLIKEVINHGVDTIIIACTDLSDLPCPINNQVLVLDSAKALASSIIKRYISLNIIKDANY